MAVQQRRTSKTRKRLRRTHFKLSAKNLITCSHCGELIQPHTVCQFCGYKDGKQIIVKKTKKVKEEEKKATPKEKAKKETSKKEEVKTEAAKKPVEKKESKKVDAPKEEIKEEKK